MIRLYIPLTIVNLITVFIGFRTASASLFLFPITINLWYIPAVIVLYILYYFNLRKFIGGGYRVLTILLTTVAYAVAYVFRYKNEFFVEPEIGFRLLYGFIAMMIGSVIYDHKDNEELKSKKILWFILGICSCGGFLFMKLFMNRIHVFLKIQFMTQAFGVAFATFMMLAGLGYEKTIRKFMKTWTGKILGIISSCSLEVYLVQFAIIRYLKNLSFPINLVLILAAMMGTAYVIHMASKKIYNVLLQICKKIKEQK